MSRINDLNELLGIQSVSSSTEDNLSPIFEDTVITKGLRRVKMEGVSLMENYIKLIDIKFNNYLSNKNFDTLMISMKPIYDDVREAMDYAYGGSLTKTTALLSGMPYSILTVFFGILGGLSDIDFYSGNKYDFDEYTREVEAVKKQNPNIVEDKEKEILKNLALLKNRLIKYEDTVQTV